MKKETMEILITILAVLSIVLALVVLGMSGKWSKFDSLKYCGDENLEYHLVPDMRGFGNLGSRCCSDINKKVLNTQTGIWENVYDENCTYIPNELE